MVPPLTIEIALWYYCRPGDYGRGVNDNNFRAPAVQRTMREFVDAGLLIDNGAGTQPQFSRTPALDAYVRALCGVPLHLVQAQG